MFSPNTPYFTQEIQEKLLTIPLTELIRDTSFTTQTHDSPRRIPTISSTREVQVLHVPTRLVGPDTDRFRLVSRVSRLRRQTPVLPRQTPSESSLWYLQGLYPRWMIPTKESTSHLILKYIPSTFFLYKDTQIWMCRFIDRDFPRTRPHKYRQWRTSPYLPVLSYSLYED